MGERRLMPWSLGTLSDLLWTLLPEARLHLVALVHHELAGAVEDDRELSSLIYSDVARDAFWAPLFEPALLGLPDSRAAALRCGAFVRAAWAFEGRDQDYLRQTLEEVVLEEIAFTVHLWTVETLDPDLHALVVDRCGSRCDLSPGRAFAPRP